MFAIVASRCRAIVASRCRAIVASGRTAIVASSSRLFRAGLSCEYITNCSIACCCNGVKCYSFAGHYIESGDFFSIHGRVPSFGRSPVMDTGLFLENPQSGFSRSMTRIYCGFAAIDTGS